MRSSRRELVPRELLLRELLTNGLVDALNSPVKKIPYESPSDPLRIALRNKELRNKKNNKFGKFIMGAIQLINNRPPLLTGTNQ